MSEKISEITLRKSKYLQNLVDTLDDSECYPEYIQKFFQNEHVNDKWIRSVIRYIEINFNVFIYNTIEYSESEIQFSNVTTYHLFSLEKYVIPKLLNVLEEKQKFKQKIIVFMKLYIKDKKQICELFVNGELPDAVLFPIIKNSHHVDVFRKVSFICLNWTFLMIAIPSISNSEYSISKMFLYQILLQPNSRKVNKFISETPFPESNDFFFYYQARFMDFKKLFSLSLKSTGDSKFVYENNRIDSLDINIPQAFEENLKYYLLALQMRDNLMLSNEDMKYVLRSKTTQIHNFERYSSLFSSVIYSSLNDDGKSEKIIISDPIFKNMVQKFRKNRTEWGCEKIEELFDFTCIVDFLTKENLLDSSSTPEHIKQIFNIIPEKIDRISSKISRQLLLYYLTINKTSEILYSTQTSESEKNYKERSYYIKKIADGVVEFVTQKIHEPFITGTGTAWDMYNCTIPYKEHVMKMDQIMFPPNSKWSPGTVLTKDKMSTLDFFVSDEKLNINTTEEFFTILKMCFENGDFGLLLKMFRGLNKQFLENLIKNLFNMIGTKEIEFPPDCIPVCFRSPDVKRGDDDITDIDDTEVYKHISKETDQLLNWFRLQQYGGPYQPTKHVLAYQRTMDNYYKNEPGKHFFSDLETSYEKSLFGNVETPWTKTPHYLNFFKLCLDIDVDVSMDLRPPEKPDTFGFGI